MAWNGSGVFSRLRSWVADAANGLHVQADLMDQDTNDIAAAVNNCLTKDGQNAAAANLPMGGFRHTNVAAGAARNEYASVAQLQDGAARYAVAGGTANAITLTLTPAVTTLVDGMEINFKASATCAAGSTTAAVNGVAAKAVKRHDGADPLSGDITAQRPYTLRYVGATDTLVLRNPSVLGALTGAINDAAATVAAAATTAIGAATGNYLTVTGTTTISAFDAAPAGAERTLTFAAALTLTHNATSLILPGAANITTAANDAATFRSEGAGNWRCTSYTKANGQAVAASASGALTGLVAQQTSGFTLGATHNYKLTPVSGTFTVTVPVAATLGVGTWCLTNQGTGTGTVTLATGISRSLHPGQTIFVVCDGTSLVFFMASAPAPFVAAWSSTDKSAGMTLSVSDTRATRNSSSAWAGVRSVSSVFVGFPGDYEITYTITQATGGYVYVGVVAASAAFDGAPTPGIIYRAIDGQKSVNGVASAYGAPFTTGDVIKMNVNCFNGAVTFFKNGTSQGVAGYLPPGAWFAFAVMYDLNNAVTIS